MFSSSFFRRAPLRAAALLLAAAPAIGVAADALFLRPGMTRDEVEKLVGAPLAEMKKSMYKSAFGVSEATENLRAKLPAPLAKLPFNSLAFYFDDAGKLWRVRFIATLPANDALATMLDTAKVLEGSAGLNRMQQDDFATAPPRKVPAPTVCYDDEGDGVKLKPKAAKLLSERWKTYSQPERYAVRMNLNCGSEGYLSYRFVTASRTWHAVNFEMVDRLDVARLDEVLPKATQANLVYVMVQSSEARPGLEETEDAMEK